MSSAGKALILPMNALCLYVSTWYLEMNYSLTMSDASQYTAKEGIGLEPGSHAFGQAWTWLPTTLGPIDPGSSHLDGQTLALSPISSEHYPPHIIVIFSGQLLHGPSG